MRIIQRLALLLGVVMSCLVVAAFTDQDVSAYHNVTECYVEQGSYDSTACNGMGSVQDAILESYRKQTRDYINAGGSWGVLNSVYVTCRDQSGRAQTPQVQNQNVGAVWFTTTKYGKYEDSNIITVPVGATGVPVYLQTSVNRCWNLGANSPFGYRLERVYRKDTGEGIFNGIEDINRGNMDKVNYAWSDVGTYGSLNIPLKTSETATAGIRTITICTEGRFAQEDWLYVFEPALRCYPLMIRVNDWYIEPSISIDRNEVYPGETITWTHKVQAFGNMATPNPTRWGYNSTTTTSNPLFTSNASLYENNLGSSGSASRTSSFPIAADAIANGVTKYCRTTYITTEFHNSPESSGHRESNEACATLLNYVTPFTDANKARVPLEGSVEFEYSVTSNPDNRPVEEKHSYIFILANGGNITDAENVIRHQQNNGYNFGIMGCGDPDFPASPPLPINRAGGRSITHNSPAVYNRVLYCKETKINENLPKNQTAYIVEDPNIAEYKWFANLGDKICSYLVIGWRDSTYHTDASNIVCVDIYKQPQIQIFGADSASGAAYWGDELLTNPVDNPDKYDGGFVSFDPPKAERGSWSQYGLLANGEITSFGSAGYTAHSSNASRACKLLFANTTATNGSACSSLNNAGEFGNNGRRISLPSVQNANNGGGGVILNIADAPEGVTSYTPSSGTLRIAGGAVQKNRHATIYVNGNVQIEGDITYAGNGSYRSLTEIPYLTIYATGNISVAGAVDELNGNYVANGDFITCANAVNNPAALGDTGGVCNRELLINGAVVTKGSLKLYRTSGGGLGGRVETAPAEIFNYTPNTFLTPWAKATADSGSWVTKNQKVLPARL